MDISQAISTDQDTASMESQSEEPLSLHLHPTTSRGTATEQRARRRGGRGVVGRNQVVRSVSRSQGGDEEDEVGGEGGEEGGGEGGM